jgi:hypothetical protein
MDNPLQGEAVVRGKECNTPTGTPLGVQCYLKNVNPVRQPEAARIIRLRRSLIRTLGWNKSDFQFNYNEQDNVR